MVVFVIVKIVNKANSGLGELTSIAKAVTIEERIQFKKEGKTNKEIRTIAKQRVEKARLEAEEQKKANAKPTTEQLLTEIRDLLKDKQ